MEMNQQLSGVQDDLKLLKGEIKNILKELRGAILAEDNPFTKGAGTPTFGAVGRGEKADAEEPEKEEPPLLETPDDYTPFSKRGQVWQLGDHRLMCGDASEDVQFLLPRLPVDVLFQVVVAAGVANAFLVDMQRGGLSTLGVLELWIRGRPLVRHHAAAAEHHLARESVVCL